MPRRKLYVIHATVRYTLKSKDGRTESGESRPTIPVEATSETAAIKKATAQERKRVDSEYWKCVALHLSPALVKVMEIAK